MRDKKMKNSSYSAGSTTLIAEGTHIVGELRFSGNLEIEGRVTGNIIAEEGDNSRVRILQTGVVEGEIKVPSLVVNGLVEGDLYVTKHLELAGKAVVQGTVHYDVIEIEKGAQVNGSFIRDAAIQVSEKEESDGQVSSLEAVGV